MSIPEIKSRIAPIAAEDLSNAVAECGDAVRGWWACAAGRGRTHIERAPHHVGFDAGVARAHALVDEGVGCVVLSAGSAVPDDARAIVGLLCGADATRITPPQANDHDWMLACRRLRDAQALLRDRVSDAMDVIDDGTTGLIGLLLGLSARRTPTLLIGSAAHAAALIAQRQSLAASGWWRSGYSGADPIDALTCARLQYESWWTSLITVDDEVTEDLVAATINSLRSSQ